MSEKMSKETAEGFIATSWVVVKGFVLGAWSAVAAFITGAAKAVWEGLKELSHPASLAAMTILSLGYALIVGGTFTMVAATTLATIGTLTAVFMTLEVVRVGLVQMYDWAKSKIEARKQAANKGTGNGFDSKHVKKGDFGMPSAATA